MPFKGKPTRGRAPKAPPPSKEPIPTVKLGPCTLGPDLMSLVAAGHAADEAKHQEEAQEKLGLFRAGNAGVVLFDADGNPEVHASCPRVAWSRTVAAKEPERQGPGSRASTKALMFGAGNSNEDLWTHDLRAWVESLGGRLAREEDIPLTCTLPGGGKLSGRPDLVMFDAKGKAQCGVELKLISSINTALEVAIEGPKLEHMAQAMAYQLMLSESQGRDVPYQLWYTSRAVFSNPGWSFLPKPPAQGEPGSEFHEYGRSGQPSKFPMNFVGFYLRWHEGRVHWARANGSHDTKVDAAGRGTWVPTDVTIDSLDAFWVLAEAVGQGDLGPRPVKKGFDKCNYCGFQGICDQLESTPDAWKKAIEATGRQ